MTATETNNKGFEVERLSNSQWEKIGYVPGSGTTTEPKTYTFGDNNVGPGAYSYRLKQIDFDGSFEYSKQVEVNIIVPSQFSLKQNFPNPFNPSTKIEFTISQDGFVKLIIYNSLGQQIAVPVNRNIESGNHTVIFNASNLSSGVYYYRLEAGSAVLVKKMIVLK